LERKERIIDLFLMFIILIDCLIIKFDFYDR